VFVSYVVWGGWIWRKKEKIEGDVRRRRCG
jgi:hypothetical protein